MRPRVPLKLEIEDELPVEAERPRHKVDPPDSVDDALTNHLIMEF